MRPVNLKTKGTFLIKFSLYFYRPRSIASEGYVFTGACHFNSGGGGGGRPGDYTSLTPTHPPGLCRGVVSTGPLAHGHLIFSAGHLLLDSTGPDWPPKF